MDEHGFVTDLELAKKILIEFFTTAEYQYRDSWFHDKDGHYKKFLNQIKNELQQFDGGFVFFEKDGTPYFGGPEGDSGLYIQELNEWYRIWKIQGPSVDGAVSDLNNQRKVFYEVDGELKCFIILEMD